MNNKDQSMRDIANALNVTVGTVSSVLNGKAAERRISEKTKQRILAYITQCSYQPNMIARSLRTGKSRVVGMLVEDMANPFFAAIAKNMERILFNLNYKLFCSSSENDTQKAVDLLNAYKESRADGYIVAPMPGLEQTIEGLISNDSPVVLFDSYIPNLKEHSIIVDNFEGTYNATRHLQNNGYSNIAFITIDSMLAHLEDRALGYIEALKENKSAIFISRINHEASTDLKRKEIAHFLTENTEIDAVIFGTNYLTITGLLAIKKLGKKIPVDMAVVSFDDIEYFQLVTPEITTIAQPIENYVKKISIKLLGKINKKNIVTSEMVLKTILIERGSSAPKVKIEINY